MGDDVTVSFTKSDGTTGSLSFSDVDEVNETGSPGSGYDLILYRESDTNGTINNLEDHSVSWN